jgi:hypothetical protein
MLSEMRCPLPIFWSEAYEQKALHEAYQSGHTAGYEEGKRQGELEAKAIIRDFMVKIRCDLSPEVEFTLPPLPPTLEDWKETAHEACKTLVAKIVTLRTELAAYRRQFNQERIDQLNQQISNLQGEIKTAKAVMVTIAKERDDARTDSSHFRNYALSLERKIKDQQAAIVELQNKLDRAKNAGK